ncbi:MAG: hypothetical protein EAY75_00510 [Bacteroidetes bacterium]|nr:MAG: hypothetical protein EAY75_00510 [Bacteroidota bacterium]
MKKRTDIVATRFQDIASQSPKDSPEFNYFDPISHGTPRNVFYFERQDVLSIFFGKDAIPGISDKAPDFLMVALGAHYETTPGFREGQPTTILMGIKVVSESKTDEFDSNKIRVVPLGSLSAVPVLPNTSIINPEDEEVGYEYPPSSGIIDVPPSV